MGLLYVACVILSRLKLSNHAQDRICFLFEKMKENLDSYIEILGENYEELDSKIESLSNQIDRSLDAMKNIHETTKPMKPNNWDSVKDVFRGPVRVDINERD